MKRSLFLLASLALSSALYAQAESLDLSREQVLDIFAQYNPTVLEKAQQNADYQAALDQFLQTFSGKNTAGNRFDTIAAARNFENSLRLNALAEAYLQQAVLARMSSQDYTALQRLYRQDVKDVMSDIWAVSLQMRYFQLEEAKKALKALQREDLPAEQKKSQTDELKKQIKSIQAEISALKKQSGQMIVSYTEQQLAATEEQINSRLSLNQHLAAQQQQSSAKQATNLQIKTNHKKPVAK